MFKPSDFPTAFLHIFFFIIIFARGLEAIISSPFPNLERPQ